MLLELLAKRGDGGSGTGIDERSVILREKKSSGNGARMASPMKINRSGGVHR